MMRYPHIQRLVCLALCAVLAGGCAQQPPRAAAPPAVAELRACAESAYQARQLPRAEGCFRQLLQADATAAIDWYRLGNVYAWTRRPALAVDAYVEALERNPDLADAWFNLGMVQMQQAVHSLSIVRDQLREDDPLYKQADTIISGVLRMIMDTAREQPGKPGRQ